MKWIGQNVWDLISRFRSDVYLEDIASGTIASGGNLGLDSNNKIVKATEASGDLTGITAGTGLSGTNLTGPVPTLNVDASQTQITAVGTIATGEWRGTAIAHAYIGDSAIESDNIADNAVNSEHYVDGSIDTAHIGDDQVTFAKASGVSPKVFGSVIKILPSDFMSNDDGGSTKFGIGFIETDGTTFGMKIPNANTELIAFVSIPEGMKATHVDIFDDSDNRAIEVFEANVNSRTITSKGSGNCNTTLDITDVNATATNYLMIVVTTTGTGDRTYGGTITIAAQ